MASLSLARGVPDLCPRVGETLAYHNSSWARERRTPRQTPLGWYGTGEDCGWLLIQGAVQALGVVILLPLGDDLSRLGQADEPVCVEALIAEPALCAGHRGEVSGYFRALP